MWRGGSGRGACCLSVHLESHSLEERLASEVTGGTFCQLELSSHGVASSEPPPRPITAGIRAGVDSRQGSGERSGTGGNRKGNFSDSKILSFYTK